MKAWLFLVCVISAAAALAVSGPRLLSALRRSPPRPELEPYLRERLAREGDSPDLLREVIRLRQGRDPAAERSLRERLAAAAPEDGENLEALLNLHLWENRTAEAYGLADRLIDRFPERADLRERLVELAEYLGRPAEAHPHARWLLERGARLPRMVRVFAAAGDLEGLASVVASPRERARMLTAGGAQREAILAYAEHLAQDPGDWTARRELAQLYVWNGRPLDAAVELEKVLAVTRDPALREQILAVYRSTNRIDLMLAHLPENLERSEILVALGRLEEARAILKKLGRVDRLLELSLGAPTEEEEAAVRETMPLTEENRWRLAALYAWRKDFRKALEFYESVGAERAIDLYLTLGDLQGALRAARKLDLPARLGELHVWAGDIPAAIAAYERVPSERRELARLYVLVGRREEAVKIIETLDAEPYTLAELFLYAGRADRTLEILEAIPAEEFDPPRVARLALSADRAGAEALYELLLRRRPGTEAYLLALADLYQGAGRDAEAARLLRPLLEKRPADAALHARVGLLLRDRALLERAWDLGSRTAEVARMLGEIAYQERRWKDAVAHFRALLVLKGDDYEARFLVAELTNDPEEYDRAWRILPAGERKIRARILLWRKDLSGALRILRESDDAPAKEVLVDLLLEAGREADALSLGLTPRQRAVLAIRRGRHEEAVGILRGLDVNDPDIRRALAESLLALGRWDEAEALIPGVATRERAVAALRRGLYREALDLLSRLDSSDPEVRKARVECLLELGRWDEADALIAGSSTRHRAVQAMKAGRFEEAAALFARLDSKDPEVSSARAECLLALGRWQEAERIAPPELRRTIQGTYGPESSAEFRHFAAADERHWTLSGRHRAHVSERAFLRLEGSGSLLEGHVAPGLEEETRSVERAAASIHYRLPSGLRLGGGVLGWTEEDGSGAGGLAEAEFRQGSWSIEGEGEAGAPWLDSFEAVAAGGVRHRALLQITAAPIPRLFLSASGERLWYEAGEDLELDLEGERASEDRWRARAELRLWTGPGLAGRRFFDPPLRDERFLESHLALVAQADLSETEGSPLLLAFTQLAPQSRMYTVGPSAGLAGGGWGIGVRGFVGMDSERDLDFGKVWGGSVQGLGALSDRVQLSSVFEYVSEQRQTAGGSAWALSAGLNINF